MYWPPIFTIDATFYTLAQHLFLRSLGVVYLLAFISLATQAKGLLGKNGLLPIHDYVKNHRPISFFRWNASDFLIVSSCYLGIAISILLILDIGTIVAILALLLIYLSFVSVGQNFFSFQWDALLLEVSFIAFFFSLSTPPSLFLLIALWILLFRLLFSSGVVKLISGDKNWQALTALQYHYETQPLPNRIAWYLHQLPAYFHKVSIVFLFAAELLAPFLIFGTDSMRYTAFIFLVALQIVLILSGNFSFLNYLTLVLCIPLLSNSDLEWFSSLISITPTNHPIVTSFALDGIGCFFIFLNIAQLFRLFARNKWLSRFLHSLQPFHISSAYGLFAVMTTSRIELVIQGSQDGTDFLPYEFYYKPQNLYAPPRQIAPLHPRLDWQMWFAALNPEHIELWLNHLMTALLHQNSNVIKLLKTNPFPKNAPRYIRMDIYQYNFCSRKTRQETGQWWERKLLAIGQPLELKK